MNQLLFSPVIAGCMKWGIWGAKFSTEQYIRMIEDCLQLGITTFDHADIYGHYTTEEEFGKAIASHSSLRTNMQIITKCGIKMVSSNRPSHLIKSYDTSKEHIVHSVEKSLSNLATDYVDVLLIHRPDPLMNADEIAEAFFQLKQQGKVLHFGVSNFTPSQVSLLNKTFRVEINQVEASVTKLDPFTDGTLDQCQIMNIIPLAWSPLGGGNLFTDNDDERNKRINAVAHLLGERYGVSPDQVILNWLFKHPAGIVPVLGTSKISRIKAALKATSFSITREEWFMLWRASTGNEVP